MRLQKKPGPRTPLSTSTQSERRYEVRSALGDSAETPRFIETLARRGYRFLARWIFNPEYLLAACPSAAHFSVIGCCCNPPW